MRPENRFLILITPYMLFVGTCYMHGFWWSFGINALEHANIFDAIAMSLTPYSEFALSIIVACAAGFLILQFMFSRHDFLDVNRLRPSSKVAFYFLAAIMNTILFYLDEYIAWTSATVFGAVAIAHLLKLSQFFDFIQNQTIQFLVIFFVAILPVGALCMGKINALNITSEYKYLSSKIGNLEVRYIGHLNNKYFFYEPVEKIIIITPDDTPQLNLKLVRNHRPFGIKGQSNKP